LFLGLSYTLDWTMILRELRGRVVCLENVG